VESGRRKHPECRGSGSLLGASSAVVGQLRNRNNMRDRDRPRRIREQQASRPTTPGTALEGRALLLFWLDGVEDFCDDDRFADGFGVPHVFGVRMNGKAAVDDLLELFALRRR